MENNRIKAKNPSGIFMSWMAAILFYLLLYPYFVWDYVGLFNWIVLIPLYLILLINTDFSKGYKYPILFGLLTILASICNGQNFIGTVFGIGLAFIFLTKKSFLMDTYDKFYRIFTVIAILSLVSYSLVSIGISLPNRTIPPLNSLKPYNYLAYPFFVRSMSMVEFARFCGPFDEPGALGTASLLILVIERFNLKKIGNIAIIFSGILSLSLFFYAALAIYLLFLIFAKSTNNRTRFSLFIIFAIGVFFVIRNPVTNAVVVERLQWDAEKNSITGDDRSRADLDDYIDNIKGTNIYYWGLRDTNLRDSFNDSASLKNAILRYGMVTVVLYFVFYFFYARSFCGFSWRTAMFMVILFVLLYNRPSMFDVGRVFMYNMCLFSIASLTNNNVKENK